MLTGGYPPALTLESTARARWFDGYVATYVERDLQQIASISSLADFRRLLALACARVGGLLNRADLARDAALSRPTAHRWIDLLQISFQLRLLPAFAASPSQRIVKAAKLYRTATGLAAHRAGLATPTDVNEDLRGGAWLENLILCDLDAWRETLAPRPEVYHWRTVDKTEVDLVLEHRRRLLPIEVKAAASVTGRDTAGLERFLATHRRARFGIVAYGGNEVHTLSARVLAVPVRRLLG